MNMFITIIIQIPPHNCPLKHNEEIGKASKYSTSVERNTIIKETEINC